MSERVAETREARQEERSAEAPKKMAWETPEMEDVSEQVMAQPYIRFT
ncbi:MAG: hypothetical protein U5L06_05295 [Rhodovibrio sp.]|nr:hypothetical protein [Rhodovibrio sp.]